MPLYYVLDESNKPKPVADVIEWSDWMKTHPNRIAYDKVGEAEVSTIFLGINHRFTEDGTPILWETMVFNGPLAGECSRYTSHSMAIAGHAATVARIRSGHQ